MGFMGGSRNEMKVDLGHRVSPPDTTRAKCWMGRSVCPCWRRNWTDPYYSPATPALTTIYWTKSTQAAKMSVISVYILIIIVIADMKHNEIPLMTLRRIDEARGIGAKLARLRVARRIRQIDAAARAGLARSTAALIEKGDPGRTLAQVLRYLEAIAPNLSLLDLLQESDPSLKALIQAEATRRVRLLSSSELKELDF